MEVVKQSRSFGTKSFLMDNKFEFINADEIAVELKTINETSGNVSAGKEYFKRIEKLKSKNKNIILETTMSGLSLKKLIDEFKLNKYQIRIIFILINDVKVCIERIKVRVSKGGHFVPDEDVKRQYVRGKSNFWTSYRTKADEWMLIDNSEFSYEQVAIGMKRKFEVVNDKIFEEFVSSI